MATALPPDKRKIGVHISLDLFTLGQVDETAREAGLSRSELLRRMIEEMMEDKEAAAWLARDGKSILAEERVSLEDAKAELGW